MNKKFFITHYFPEAIANGLPRSGLRRLAYMTMTDAEEDKDEYFLQTDNNPYSEEDVQQMEQKKVIKRFAKFIELPEGKSLWISPEGEFIVANRGAAPFEDPDKKIICTLDDLRTFFVTHFVVENQPKKGLKRVSFMTACELPAEKYYVGKGTHRSFNDEDLKKKLEARSLIALPNPVELIDGKGTWLDADGNLWLADSKDPLSDDGRVIILTKEQYKQH